ncbi:putative eka-like protein, partial [Golovinomyces cichoracearum]
ISTDPTASSDLELEKRGQIEIDNDGQNKWIWKDGKGGYEELIKERRKQEVLARTSEIIGSDPEYIAVDSVETHLVEVAIAQPKEIADTGKKYIACPWFSQVYEFQRSYLIPLGMDRLQKKNFLQRGRKFRMFNGELFIDVRGAWKRCVPQSEVTKVLHKAHDQGGHYQTGITLKRLKTYHWPKMALNTRDYILGCLECGRNGTAWTQTQSSPRVDEPMVLLGMDFIGPISHSNLTLEETIQCCYPQLQYFNFESGGKPDYGYSGKGYFTHIFMCLSND